MKRLQGRCELRALTPLAEQRDARADPRHRGAAVRRAWGGNDIYLVATLIALAAVPLSLGVRKPETLASHVS